ncbi:MAG TPA: hypothetical protein VJ302_23315 [Blastocatellia bacterium]|nr:hypothetical protein [Blastocatellia bacterium]
MKTNSVKLVDHIVHKSAPEEPSLPPVSGGLFDYVLGATGVFVHGKRESLEVCFPIADADGEIRGLSEVEQVFKFDLPPVPEPLVSAMLETSAKFAELDSGLETLFHLIYSPVYPWNNGWELVEPAQERTAITCRPLDDGPGSTYEKAIIEVHSHHRMAARFSGQDDRDERGFRIYGVMGAIPRDPEIRVRVGVYGHFEEIPAALVMELPTGLKDCVSDECYGSELDEEPITRPAGRF